MALLVWGVILLVNGDCHITFGNFAFVRMFQGKAVLVTMIVPLLLTYTLEFFSTPNLKSWILLAMCQISGVGLSCNGLFVVPVLVALSTFACWTPSKLATQRAALGLLSSVYVVLVAVSIRSDFVAGIYMATGGVPIRMPGEFFQLMFCRDPFLWFFLLSLTCTWTVIADPPIRRWLLGIALAFMIIFLNPFLSEVLANNLTGHATTWRILWAIPFPVFLSVVLTGILGVVSTQGNTSKSVLFLAIMLALFALLVPKIWTMSSNNGARIHMPTVKIPAEHYQVARMIRDLAGKGHGALAPAEVAAWITVFRGHPDPVVARDLYITYLRSWIDKTEADRRMALFQLINGDVTAEKLALLNSSIDDLNISVVAIRRDQVNLTSILQLLSSRALEDCDTRWGGLKSRHPYRADPDREDPGKPMAFPVSLLSGG